MFRIEKLNHRSVTEIQVKFNKDIDPNISTANIRIFANVPSIDDLIVKSIRVKKSVLTIITAQQLSMVLYQVEFIAAGSKSFQSKDGETLQANNTFYFIGQEDSNDIRESILEVISSVYNVDRTTLVRKAIAMLADQLLKLRTDVLEIGNANYLSETVTDEVKIRGFGPTDRLLQEGAYELLRVATTPTGTTRFTSVNYNTARLNALLGVANVSKVNPSFGSFPVDPISLRALRAQEIVSNAETINNSFDGLLLNLSKPNIIGLESLVLNKADGTGSIVYDIPTYKYLILENRYDTGFANKLLTLSGNQIRLADAAVIAGDFAVPSGGDELVVNYVYIDNGINVDGTTVEVSQIKESGRERIPGRINVFSLDHFPIVTANDAIATSNGVSFLDPAPPGGAAPFSVTHRAFQTELPYNSSRLPSEAGEFFVNYETGQVFVYGYSTNDGTGPTPPVAVYLYRRIFENQIDYNFDADTDEAVALSSRELSGKEVKVSYRYEQVLAKDVDFVNEVHVEVIDEFVENRFASPTQISTLHRPITKVFEVFNETTGESYTVTRFSENFIYMTGFQLPRFTDVNNEIANFSVVSNENLFVTEEIFNNLFHKILSFELQNSGIVANSGFTLGSNLNSSVYFSDPATFQKEFFFDSIIMSLADNLAKLTAAGEYLINYADGVVYLRVDADHSDDYGQVSYRHSTIVPRRSQVISANELSYKKTIKSDPALSVNVDTFNSESITPQSLPASPERFGNNDTDKPILLGTRATGIAGQMNPGSYEFIALDGDFDSSYTDGYHILRIPGEPDRAITSVTSTTALLVDVPFSEFNPSTSWYVIDFDLTDGFKAAVTYPIAAVRGVYLISELQTLDSTSLINYYDSKLDTISDKTITFNSAAIQSVPAGTALAVDYDVGNLFVNYTYVEDVLRVSYEYGDNSVNFSIADSINPEKTYYATYRYGALRDKLLENFGALTQVDDLTTFPLSLKRETYRSFLLGTLQGFLRGPTVDSIKDLVEHVTDIRPNIREFYFNDWTLGQSNLHLVDPHLSGPESYEAGKYENGLIITDSTTLVLPGESYVSYRDGTFEAWVKPHWNGIDNDASLTVDISDGYGSIYIGSMAFNPSGVPFTINKSDPEPYSPIGIPHNFAEVPGHFIWFDVEQNIWNFQSTKDGYGQVDTSGEIYIVRDGYTLRSTDHYIQFDGYDDNQDGYFDGDGYSIRQRFSFTSDDLHRIFDTGAALAHNRISMYKDGSGYLNIRVFDDTNKRNAQKARFYNVSANIQDWLAGQAHHVAASWRLNSAEGIDELHLFVDGAEVSNMFKYGGRPAATSADIYRTVANEVLTSSAPKTILGSNDGVSTAGSAVFSSAGVDFAGAGIIAGDSFDILDNTADGGASPYSIVAVGTHDITINVPLTLSLENVNFSVNRATYVVSTNVDTERFAIFSNGVELNGINAETPDYSTEREAGINTIYINNGVTVADEVVINTLGLTRGRCRDTVYLYDDGYQLITRGAPPASLEHVDIFTITFPRSAITADGYAVYGSGQWVVTGNTATATFTNLTHPSNQVTGKKLSAILGGIDNIDFSGTNQITINGTTFGGPTSEVLSWTDYGKEETVNYFTDVTSVDMIFTANDGYLSFGSIEIIESISVTHMENFGDYAMVSEYDNGVFTLIVFGSNGMKYVLDAGYYLLDYPTALNIPMTTKGPLYIGSSILGTEQFDGVLDQVVLLNEQLTDIRAGEDLETQRSITKDYNSPTPLSFTPQTLLLLNLNDEVENVSQIYKTYDYRYITSSNSVNVDFGDAIIFARDYPIIIDNGGLIFNTNQCTIELWVSPLLDALYDPFDRYYVDITSLKVSQIVSENNRTIRLPFRAKRILSVRLASDPVRGADYFAEAGSELLIDGFTVFLGSRLPNSQTLVEVVYVPIDAMGDRISLLKTKEGYLVFSVTANEQQYEISYPIEWKRNTWHRVQVTLSANSADGMDQMRMFVDGIEGGLIRWGTPGFRYGEGLIYGSAAAGSTAGLAITANLDITDTFGDLFVGNSFSHHNSAKAKMDNIRFSNTIRQPSLVAGIAMDLNYNSNLDSASPVVLDDQTTLMLDFTQEPEKIETLTNLLSKYTPLFLFDVEVDDGFRRLLTEREREILVNILKKMKQSHTNIFVKYLQEL